MIDFSKLEKYDVDSYVKDLFIGFYQHLFHQNKGEFHFDPCGEVSNINISDQFCSDDLTGEFKPSIYIRRRPFNFMGTSIDQLESKNLTTGSTARTDLISGVIEVVSVSRVGLEACRLASMVFLLTNQFKDALLSKGLFDMSVKTLGEETPLVQNSTQKIVEVPVVIQVVFQYSWVVNALGTEEHKLREIILSKKSGDANARYCIPIGSKG